MGKLRRVMVAEPGLGPDPEGGCCKNSLFGDFGFLLFDLISLMYTWHMSCSGVRESEREEQVAQSRRRQRNSSDE